MAAVRVLPLAAALLLVAASEGRGWRCPAGSGAGRADRGGQERSGRCPEGGAPLDGGCSWDWGSGASGWRGCLGPGRSGAAQLRGQLPCKRVAGCSAGAGGCPEACGSGRPGIRQAAPAGRRPPDRAAATANPLPCLPAAVHAQGQPRCTDGAAGCEKCATRNTCAKCEWLSGYAACRPSWLPSRLAHWRRPSAALSQRQRTACAPPCRCRLPWLRAERPRQQRQVHRGEPAPPPLALGLHRRPAPLRTIAPRLQGHTPLTRPSPARCPLPRPGAAVLRRGHRQCDCLQRDHPQLCCGLLPGLPARAARGRQVCQGAAGWRAAVAVHTCRHKCPRGAPVRALPPLLASAPARRPHPPVARLPLPHTPPALPCRRPRLPASWARTAACCVSVQEPVAGAWAAAGSRSCRCPLCSPGCAHHWPPAPLAMQATSRRTAVSPAA